MDHNAIATLLSQHPVVLFMKGTKESPYCGFSRQVVKILQLMNVPFHGVNVLEDAELRDNLKTFSQWPTFPQLYVKQELIGGCDIVTDMYKKGELQQILSPYSEQ